MSELSQKIRDLPCKVLHNELYAQGHRDGLNAAAELVVAELASLRRDAERWRFIERFAVLDGILGGTWWHLGMRTKGEIEADAPLPADIVVEGKVSDE